MKTQKEIEKIRDEIEVEIAYLKGVLSISPVSLEMYLQQSKAYRKRTKLIAKKEVLELILQK